MKRYMSECDVCSKDAKTELELRFPGTRTGSENYDICDECLSNLRTILKVEKKVIQDTKKKVTKKKSGNMVVSQVTTTQTIAEEASPIKEEEIVFDPDEKRNVTDILKRMDAAAKKSRKKPSPSEILEKRFQSGALAEETDCEHPKDSLITLDKDSNILQCNSCGKSLQFGRGIS